MSRSRYSLLFAGGGLLFVGLGVGGMELFYPEPRTVTMRFHPTVGEEPLAFNELKYQNPGGAGLYQIRDFQFYLSNVRLTGPEEELVLEDSYHLVRFDGASAYAEIKLPAVKLADYTHIHWGIGVDPDANGTLKIAGDLDPNNRMAWNWHVGYKFILLEGRLNDGQELVPLVYHVGFDDNYVEQVLTIPKGGNSQGEDILSFNVDVEALFRAGKPLDLAATPSVKFDPDDASRIAAGFVNMIEAR